MLIISCHSGRDFSLRCFDLLLPLLLLSRFAIHGTLEAVGNASNSSLYMLLDPVLIEEVNPTYNRDDEADGKHAQEDMQLNGMVDIHHRHGWEGKGMRIVMMVLVVSYINDDEW